jgi:hypothetical protein
VLLKESENGRQPRPNGRCAQNLSKILYKIEQSSLERFLIIFCEILSAATILKVG